MSSETKRPCSKCREHFSECVCNRKTATVFRSLQCPHCTETFKVPETAQRNWVQRCSHCYRAFNADDDATRTPAPDGVEEALRELRKMFPENNTFIHVKVTAEHSGNSGATWHRASIGIGSRAFHADTLAEAMESVRHWASKEDAG